MRKLLRPSDSLAAKLIIAISALMLTGGAVFGYLFYNYEKDVTYRNLSRHALFMSDLVKQSIENEFLMGSREDIKFALESFSRARGVRAVSLYGVKGDSLVAACGSQDTKTLPMDEEAQMVQSALQGQTPSPRIARDPKTGAAVLDVYSPLINGPGCRNAACHFHKEDKNVLGVLHTSFTDETIETAGNQIMVGTLVFGILFIALVSGCLFMIFHLIVTKPVARLEEGVRRLQRGEFDRPIDIRTTDEMGRLAQNFNTMAHDIQRYKTKLESWANELQHEVERKTAEIREAQEQLINAEKLASLGRMSAGVAHELNNPLTGVVTFAHLLRERTPPERKDDIEDLDMIIEQANRCSKIIKGLLGFSRKGSSEKMRASLNDLIENSVSIISNQSAFHNIKVVLDLQEGLPPVFVDTNQIQQVILNLVTNAADAVNGPGQLTVRTQTARVGSDDFVEAWFTDTGPGIMPDHMGKIFEPFFTTKAVGKGTGLGLPVSYGIIKRHGGDLTVRSKVGGGATFIVRLPKADLTPTQPSTEAPARTSRPSNEP